MFAETQLAMVRPDQEVNLLIVHDKTALKKGILT
jgi:hypothetical protein